MEKKLTGKNAVVTGAGKGIGKAIALGLAEEGASVVCVARTRSDLEATATEIARHHGNALVMPCDVTDADQVCDLFFAINEKWGKIDLFFINAGGTLSRNQVADSDPRKWKDTVELNLLSAYYCSRYAIPLLRKSDDAKIIITGSGTGRRGAPGISAYSCAKAGLSMFARILAMELFEENITVNELIPGPVETDEAIRASSTWHEEFKQVGEWIKQPKDVVPLALFLACQPPGGPTAQSFSLMRRDT